MYGVYALCVLLAYASCFDAHQVYSSISSFSGDFLPAPSSSLADSSPSDPSDSVDGLSSDFSLDLAGL